LTVAVRRPMMPRSRRREYAVFEGLRLSHWKVSQDADGVRLLTMDRSDSRVNALSRALLDELDAML
jgi:3-hydroxyacyl-CoA dehydrogenase/enoyl-CoA hydratase/3-hydroxybutyryl-CoA epimerase